MGQGPRKKRHGVRLTFEAIFFPGGSRNLKGAIDNFIRREAQWLRGWAELGWPSGAEKWKPSGKRRVLADTPAVHQRALPKQRPGLLKLKLMFELVQPQPHFRGSVSVFAGSKAKSYHEGENLIWCVRLDIFFFFVQSLEFNFKKTCHTRDKSKCLLVKRKQRT